MTKEEAKMALTKIGFVFETEKMQHIALELIELKQEGYAIPENDDAALKAFTEKWNAFCDNNALWAVVDQIGHAKGLWF